MSGTRKREQLKDATWLNGATALIKGSVLGCCMGLVILLAASCLISAGLLSEEANASVVIAACLVGSFVGGIFAVRKGCAMPLIGGIGTGMAMSLLLFCMGALVFGASPELSSGGVVVGACLCGGGLSGVLCKSVGTKHKHKRKV